MTHGARSRTTKNRHRTMRSPVQGRYLPALGSKREAFYTVVADTGAYLISLWPDDFAGVHLEVADVASDDHDARRGQHWHIDRAGRRIVLFRLPIQRATMMRDLDALHRQMYIEYFVFRAFADFAGKEPWELAPERFRPF